MSRFSRGQILPVPPIISQLHAVEPGGIIDPASTTDCGESCCASVISVATSFTVEPGCIREAMNLPRTNGSTTAADIARLLGAMAGKTTIYDGGAKMAWSVLGTLRRHGCYTLILGNWLSVDALHWYLAFARSSDRVECMDPWTATYVDVSREEFNAAFSGQLVVCDLWSPV